MELNATLIVQIILFLLLLVWLTKILFNPLIKLFEERERRIFVAQITATEYEVKSKSIIEQIENSLKESTFKGLELLNQQRLQIANNFRLNISEEKKQALDKIESEKLEMLKQKTQIALKLEDEISNIAEIIAEKIVPSSNNKSFSAAPKNNNKMEFYDAG